jgi:acetyl-CoA acetyltransferase
MTRDSAAIVGVGHTQYTRAMPQQSPASMSLQAAVNAIRDAGLSGADIDGLAGDGLATAYVQEALGLPEITWCAGFASPFSNQLSAAVHAIVAGSCSTVLVYNTRSLMARRSARAAADAFRLRQSMGTADQRSFLGTGHVEPEPGSLFGAAGYAAWAGRYLHQFGARREHFGLLAVNGRTHAADNENAVLRTPLTIEDYLAARMIREPLSVLDMELPVDAADAFVLTTVERAADLPQVPVLVHAHAMGQTAHPDEVSNPDFDTMGQVVASKHLWRRSELTLADIDLVLPYDGFSAIALLWLENLGYCPRGQAGPMLEDSWSTERGTLLLEGKVPVNTHGGALSEGGSGGAGQVREAVFQLRGTAGPRQVADACTALVSIGGFFLNPMAAVLRRDLN